MKNLIKLLPVIVILLSVACGPISEKDLVKENQKFNDTFSKVICGQKININEFQFRKDYINYISNHITDKDILLGGYKYTISPMTEIKSQTSHYMLICKTPLIKMDLQVDYYKYSTSIWIKKICE